MSTQRGTIRMRDGSTREAWTYTDGPTPSLAYRSANGLQYRQASDAQAATFVADGWVDVDTALLLAGYDNTVRQFDDAGKYRGAR